MSDQLDSEPEEPAEPVEETLAWERRHGPRAAIAAVVAAIATLVGGIVSSTALSSQPHVALVTSLQNSSCRTSPCRARTRPA